MGVQRLPKSAARRGAYVFHGWIELLAIPLLVAGFLIGLQVRTQLWDYAIVVVAGMLWGRVAYFERLEHLVPFLIVGALFILGFILGNKTADDIALVLVYGSAIGVSFKAHQEFLRE